MSTEALALLRWVMGSVDVYFRAINVKGRRWIPVTEARGLVLRCHYIVDPCLCMDAFGLGDCPHLCACDMLAFKEGYIALTAWSMARGWELFKRKPKLHAQEEIG